jgi:putative ABC transport system permease protein
VELAQWLGFACVGLVLALVATTTVMSVQDRLSEHAVLRTIGFSGPRVFGLILGESCLLSMAGGLLGVGVATLVLATSSLSVGAEAVTVAFTPSWRLALVGVVVSLATGVVAGCVPAWQAARLEIVAALRQG